METADRNRKARVFFALWPADAERAALAEWQPALLQLCGGRAMRADTLHATLAFIGEIGQHRLEALQLAAQEVEADGFDLCFDTARYWGHNHIVYAAPNRAPPQLEHLVGALQQRLTAHRFRFDRRAHKAHVTLLRNARWMDAPLPAKQPAQWQIRDFTLVQSAHREGLMKYSVLARFPLCPPGG